MRLEDLSINELMEFDSEDGVVRFAGQRALIIDATAKGNLRKELIEHFGLSTARAVLTRFGFVQGWRMAEAMQQLFEWEKVEDWAPRTTAPGSSKQPTTNSDLAVAIGESRFRKDLPSAAPTGSISRTCPRRFGRRLPSRSSPRPAPSVPRVAPLRFDPAAKSVSRGIPILIDQASLRGVASDASTAVRLRIVGGPETAWIEARATHQRPTHEWGYPWSHPRKR